MPSESLAGIAAFLEQDGGIQRAHVAVVDVAGEALEEQVGIAALEGARRLGRGQGMPDAQVLAQEQRLDLAGVAAHADGLQREGQDLALREVRVEQNRGDGRGFADVVGRIAQEGGGIAPEGGGDFAALDVGAVGRGHAEVAGDGLERVVFEGAVGDVVGQRQQIGVHDLAAVEVGARIGHGALGGAEARGVDFRPAAVAAEGQRHAVVLGARREVGQVELEQVVAGHDVRIALAHELHELLQHGLFVEVLRRRGSAPSPGRRRGRWRGCGPPRGRRWRIRARARNRSRCRGTGMCRSGRSRSPKEVRPVSSRNCWTGSRRTK